MCLLACCMLMLRKSGDAAEPRTCPAAAGWLSVFSSELWTCYIVKTEKYANIPFVKGVVYL